MISINEPHPARRFRCLPIGAPLSYLDAADRADGQCEHLSKPRRAQDPKQRCNASLNGGHRLYLDEEGRLLCVKHFDQTRLARRKA